MRICIAFLSILLCLPMLCRAEMIGTSDTRRYVTAEEKSQFPYNTIVNIAGAATGTFVAPKLILTCRHCINSKKSGEMINYTTTDGQQGTGLVYYISAEERENNVGLQVNGAGNADDYGFIITKTAHPGPFLGVARTADGMQGVGVKNIGYGALKILSDDELNIIKVLYAKYLQKYNNTVTNENVIKILVETVRDIQVNHSCKSEQDTNCVHCNGDMCILEDNANLKVDESCNVTSVDSQFVRVNCKSSHGYSGSAIINRGTSEIIGIVAKGEDTIGYKTEPDVDAVRPEYYYNILNSIRNTLILDK